MIRRIACSLAIVVAFSASLLAQDGIKKGAVKSVDPEKDIIVISADGKDLSFIVTDETRIMDVAGKPVKDRLKDKAIKEGVAVMFKAETKDGKMVLVGLKLAGDDKPVKLEKADTSKLKPLTELGKDEYKDFPGGLYPDGKNERPAVHEKAGLAFAKQVQPLDADGKPDGDGKIVLISVGMSNTTQEFSAFQKAADADKAKNPKLVLVDGAQGAMTAARIQDPEAKNGGEQFWATVDQRLKTAGVTRAQVQVAWVKEADARPADAFPKHAQTLEAELAKIAQVLHDRFPNLKLVYVSSRIYAGYATTPLNPEPYAYESGFAVKWLIEKQIKGDKALNYDPERGKVKATWLSWGPYLWANGPTKRADGLTYEESDFSSDGTHPSNAGREKVADQLLSFFKSDSTTKPWFVKK
jgi:hypothetical protein